MTDQVIPIDESSSWNRTSGPIRIVCPTRGLNICLKFYRVRQRFHQIQKVLVLLMETWPMFMIGLGKLDFETKITTDLGKWPKIHGLPLTATVNLKLSHSFCGGSIVSSRFVLTAAHCIEETTVNKLFVTTGHLHRYNSYASQEKYYQIRASEAFIGMCLSFNHFWFWSARTNVAVRRSLNADDI